MLYQIVYSPFFLVKMRCCVLASLMFLFILAARPISAENVSTIHFVAFVPYITGGNLIKSDHFGYKAAIQMAVDIINNRTDILPDFKMKVHFGETFVIVLFNFQFSFSVVLCTNCGIMALMVVLVQ